MPPSLCAANFYAQELEGRVGKHDANIAALFAAIRELMAPAKKTTQGIGFLADIK